MSNAKKTYWAAFNILGRIVGAGFILAGAIILLSGVMRHDGLIGLSGVIVVSLGALLILARPSHPGRGGAAPPPAGEP